jgi:dolichyl-phosphate-mannose-protein mannosyltransferase
MLQRMNFVSACLNASCLAGFGRKFFLILDAVKNSFFENNVVCCCCLLTLSLVLHLGWLALPNGVVFDEVHYAKCVSGYISGMYFFDSHPPLAKMLIAEVARLAGVKPIYQFLRIGTPYPGRDFLWLRLLPAFFGSLLVPLIYLIAYRSNRTRATAAIAGLFILFDNALLIQTKFILLEPFLLVFGFLALLLFWESRVFFVDGRWGEWTVLGAAVAVGLCIATKWTGVGFWGLLLASASWRTAKRIWHRKKGWGLSLASCCILVAVPLLVYVIVFFLHFSMLPQSGSGNRLMTQRFQVSQTGGYPLRDFPENFWELNRAMYSSHVRTTSYHRYGSSWYVWPFMSKPVFYWQSPDQTVHTLSA